MKRSELKDLIRKVIEEGTEIEDTILTGKKVEEDEEAEDSEDEDSEETEEDSEDEIPAGSDLEKTYIGMIEKSIKDELSAVISYVIMANVLEGTDAEGDVSAHLLEHADDEYVHFKELIAYANNHGVLDKIKIEIDSELVNNLPSELEDVVELTQELETGAIELYNEMANVALDARDFETYDFAKDAMTDEMGHFDDFSIWSGDVRSF